MQSDNFSSFTCVRNLPGRVMLFKLLKTNINATAHTTKLTIAPMRIFFIRKISRSTSNSVSLCLAAANLLFPLLQLLLKHASDLELEPKNLLMHYCLCCQIGCHPQFYIFTRLSINLFIPIGNSSCGDKRFRSRFFFLPNYFCVLFKPIPMSINV